jgi:diguanylate cyclase (GGDEF)-like protein
MRANERLNEALSQLYKKTRNESIINEIIKSVHRSTNLEEVLENAVESMSRHVDGVDNVSIYFVEGDEAVMKAYRGYPDIFIKRARRIPYPKGFTWKTIIEGKPRYVPDVDKDDVIGPVGREAGTKSYVSMPIKFEGKTIGCININSLQKNAFDQDELDLLEAVASQIEAAIANAQNATLDWLTGCVNKKLGMFFLEKHVKLSKREGSRLTVCYMDIDDLKKVNDTWGHKEGDELIKISSSVLKKSLRESDIVCRMGGDEFLVILPNTSLEDASVLWTRVEENIALFNERATKPYTISISCGFAEYDPSIHKTPADLIEAADIAMYEGKRSRKTGLFL